MNLLPVIAVFDAGKTNKKLLLFDQDYRIVFEKSVHIDEITDEDGDPCEDIAALRSCFFSLLDEAFGNDQFDLRAINYTAYGASFVYVDEKGNVLTPLYNYLKPYPAGLHGQFYNKYGGETRFAHETASPVLGSLNSGLQLYRLKYEQPGVFEKTRWALHLPQYISYLLTGKAVSDMTSIGSHTSLWDFARNDYHQWVTEEEVKNKLAPLQNPAAGRPVTWHSHPLISGTGLHDSSAALIPYLVSFKEPFVLISTGTWSITLNPFNHTPLSAAELKQDCLCYLDYKGEPVKASRLFAGFEHDEYVKRLALHFAKAPDYHQNISYNPSLIPDIGQPVEKEAAPDPSLFDTYEEAYHHFMLELVKKQIVASGLVMTQQVKQIFVAGGFSRNKLYMNLLAVLYNDKQVYATAVSESTALGAALVLHASWNDKAVPRQLIQLEYYSRGETEK